MKREHGIVIVLGDSCPRDSEYSRPVHRLWAGRLVREMQQKTGGVEKANIEANITGAKQRYPI